MDEGRKERLLFALSVPLLLWLVLLFRVLASTAEDYFSPSPEMLSSRLGLPPRFAGATLLALGNGAPDVSATVNAITSDPKRGYLLSLGALTGAGMFVGTAVAGTIILSSGEVPCRGALLRDAAAYVVALSTVLTLLWKGHVGIAGVGTLFGLYGLYVVTVLAADVYHRTIVIPKKRRREQRRVSKLMSEYGAIDTHRTPLHLIPETSMGKEVGDECNCIGPTAGSSSQLGAHLTNESGTPEGLDRNEGGVREGNSMLSLISQDSQPTLIGESISMLSNYDPNSLRLDGPVVLHGPKGILAENEETSFYSDPLLPGDCDLLLLPVEEENIENIKGVSVDKNPHFNLFSALWNELQELMDHFRGVLWIDTFCKPGTSFFMKILLVCEMPFTVLRKLTVPVPCEGYYCRPLLAVSLAFSPLWIMQYLRIEFGADLSPYQWWICAVSAGLGIAVLAVSGKDDMSLKVAGPLALYGFILAAMWIDVIANQLVATLEFLGIVCNVPSPLMGLTVLAWGNSIGDLATNSAMARKGLANMAMTACFAGPIFNLLVGLGIGFSSARSKTETIGIDVSLPPSIAIGFLFLICNCTCIIQCGFFVFRGTIPGKYGYAMFVIYGCYILASLASLLL